MRILLIINSKAGMSNRAQCDPLSWIGLFSGHTLVVETPESPEDVRKTVRRGVDEGFDRILAAGGDGTINHVASALAGTQVPLGILPFGTVNVLARQLGIPRELEQAVQVALTGKVRSVDMGMANGEYFTLMAGLGFDAQVVSELLPRMKELLGSLAYITTGLQMLARYKPSQFTLTMEGETITIPAWLLVVGNASFYAYELSIAPDASMDDGLLDVIIFTEQGVLDRITQIGAVFAGRHIQHPNVLYFRTSALSIQAEPPVTVQLDGDAAGISPVNIIVCRKALRVVAPE